MTNKAKNDNAKTVTNVERKETKITTEKKDVKTPVVKKDGQKATVKTVVVGDKNNTDDRKVIVKLKSDSKDTKSDNKDTKVKPNSSKSESERSSKPTSKIPVKDDKKAPSNCDSISKLYLLIFILN